MQQIDLLPAETQPNPDPNMLKHVNAVALMPTKGGRRITVFERKLYNVLLHRAQGLGVQDEYSARMHEIIKDTDFGSNNTEHVKKALKNLMTTVVEWQSPTSGEIEDWEACVLISGAAIRKNKSTKAVTLTWRYDVRIREQLLSPDRYARLIMESITQLRTHAAIALYEICVRYVDNPGRKTARQHWRWWRPVLCGQAYEAEKGEYRYFKRDVLLPAIAEINQYTELEISKPLEFKERDNKTISDLQFEVRLKSSKAMPATDPKTLDKVQTADLHLIGLALKLGLTQDEAEKLYQQHGAEALKKGLGDLEKRMAMPEQVTAAVGKPGAYLRTIMRSNASASAKATPAKPESRDRTDKELEHNKAALMEEWLRRKKDHLRSLFQELPEADQAELLAKFRELVSSQLPSMLKRLETSGWNHKMLRDNFAMFLGEAWQGAEWNKPTLDELLTLALEKASSTA